MSLIFPSQTVSKDHKKFLSKLQRYYHKRGSSFYTPNKKGETGSFTTKISSMAIDKIKILMDDFVDKIQQFIKQFTVLDHYSFLDIARKNSFFREINNLVDKSLHSKIDALQQQLVKKQQKINLLKKQEKKQYNQNTESNEQQNLQKIQNFDNKNCIKYNSSQCLATNLYYHARALSQEDFLQFYNKISLTNPITFKKVKGQQTQRKILESAQENDSLIIEKLNQLIKYTKSHNNQKQAEALKSLLKEYISNRRCKKPCCYYRQVADPRVNKAKALMNTTFIKFEKNIYRDNESQQYLLRRCRNTHWNMREASKAKVPDINKLEIKFNNNFGIERNQYQDHQPMRQ